MQVSAMNYEPKGRRGMSGSVRAGAYGFTYDDYYQKQSFKLITIVQIETEQAVEAADSIAAVDGVDIMFVGPADLTHTLGIPGQLDHPDFTKACTRVISACRKHNKIAGILLRDLSLAVKAAEQGFSFIAAGSDTGVLVSSMKSILESFQKRRTYRMSIEKVRSSSGCIQRFFNLMRAEIFTATKNYWFYTSGPSCLFNINSCYRDGKRNSCYSGTGCFKNRRQYRFFYRLLLAENAGK